MGASVRHVLEQGAMLRALGAQALGALRHRDVGARPSCPTPWIEREIAAPSAGLVRDFVKGVGGDPSAYRRELPFHMFPQWGLALASEAASHASYPMARVMNAGCAVEVLRPLPAGEPLLVKARLESIDDNGARAILTERVVTGTPSAPEAIVADIHAYIPLRDRSSGETKTPSEDRRLGGAALVPADAREIAFARIGASAGRDFALLSGDFNPVHWFPAYARAAGFRAPILHGFATFSRAVEALIRRVFSGDLHAISRIDVRLRRPMALPASVGVYVRDHEVFVGDAPGGAAYLTGAFSRSGGETS